MAQDLRGRKTRLSDDSDFYKPEEQKTEGETFRSLRGSAKRPYFFDYILPRFLIFAAIIAAVIFLALHFLMPHKTHGFYIAVINGELAEEQKNDLEEKTSVFIDDSFRLDAAGMEKLQVYLANSQIDLILAPQKTYEKLAAYGLLADLDDLLDQDQKDRYADLIERNAGYLDDDNLGFQDTETGKGPVLPYGIRIPEGSPLRFFNISDQVEDYGAKSLGSLLSEDGGSQAEESEETTGTVSFIAAVSESSSRQKQDRKSVV